MVGWNDAVRSIVSVTDSKNNLYIQAVAPTVNSTNGGLSQAIFYAKNIVAASGGTNVVNG